MKYLLILLTSVFSVTFEECPKESQAENDFTNFTKDFARDFAALQTPTFSLSFADNLDHIASFEHLDSQKIFFESVRAGLNEFDFESLDSTQKIDWKILDFETDLSLERIRLESGYLSGNEKPGEELEKIYELNNGKEWYEFYVKKWLGEAVEPDLLFEFGLQEINMVQEAIDNIMSNAGMGKEEFYEFINGKDFYISDVDQIQKTFELKKEIVRKRLPLLFHNPDRVPEVIIRRGENPSLAQVPGFYRSSELTFFYNIFDKPYNTRQFDWLFIHEAIPGHHFQTSIARSASMSEFRDMFFYSGFTEGWAAYVEYIGTLVGLYKTPWDYLGKWEWDLVRSVRVSLDVGLNYYGWSDEKALAFWRAYIPNQYDIAHREIARMKRWPAQVHTYKYGTARIMQLKEKFQDKMGGEYDIKDFHEAVIGKGPVPLQMLEWMVIQ